MEKFNPSDPRYKKIADLPENQKEKFVDVEGGGFVRKEAADYGYNQAYDLAQEMIRIKKPYTDYKRFYDENEKQAEINLQEKKFQEEKSAAIENFRKEREPYKKKKILFIEDSGENIEGIKKITTNFPGEEYVVANSLDKANAHLGDSDIILTDRFFPISSDAEPSDNGSNILKSYPDKTALITLGGYKGHDSTRRWERSCVEIVYHNEGQEKMLRTNIRDKESSIEKRDIDWIVAHNFATGAYQALEKLSGTDIFKSYYHDSLASFFSKFACGSPAQVEELAFKEILSLGRRAKKEFPLSDFVMQYAFSVAKTDNEWVLLMRKFWPPYNYSRRAFVGMTTSNDPDSAYERDRDEFIRVVNKTFEGSGCKVGYEPNWQEERHRGRDVSYELSLYPLYENLMSDAETANKVAKFKEKIESLLQ